MSGLAFRDLRVRLGGRRVLDGVSGEFRAGQVTAVVGPNGAGKSTLLACLAGLRRPEAGEVRLEERPLADWPARERARRLALLPQAPEIAWAVDVRTFVGLGRIPYVGAWGLGEADRAAVEAAMASTSVAGLADRVIQTLSGGERARVLIARALAAQPAWLLADEPFTGLDPGHMLDAAELFAALARRDGLGVVLTLHDLDAALRLADHVLVLDRGVVLADGPPTQALTPATLAAAYGVQARVTQGANGSRLEIVGRVAPAA